MRALALTALLLPVPALADPVTWQCAFSTACYDGACSDTRANYRFVLNLEDGVGEMQSDGTSYPGQAVVNGDLMTFFLANGAGVEMTSISASGRAVYEGHMADGPGLTTYRLDGQCKRVGPTP